MRGPGTAGDQAALATCADPLCPRQPHPCSPTFVSSITQPAAQWARAVNITTTGAAKLQAGDWVRIYIIDSSTPGEWLLCLHCWVTGSEPVRGAPPQARATRQAALMLPTPCLPPLPTVPKSGRRLLQVAQPITSISGVPRRPAFNATAQPLAANTTAPAVSSALAAAFSRPSVTNIGGIRLLTTNPPPSLLNDPSFQSAMESMAVARAEGERGLTIQEAMASDRRLGRSQRPSTIAAAAAADNTIVAWVRSAGSRGCWLGAGGAGLRTLLTCCLSPVPPQQLYGDNSVYSGTDPEVLQRDEVSYTGRVTAVRTVGSSAWIELDREVRWKGLRREPAPPAAGMRCFVVAPASRGQQTKLKAHPMPRPAPCSCPSRCAPTALTTGKARCTRRRRRCRMWASRR